MTDQNDYNETDDSTLSEDEVSELDEKHEFYEHLMANGVEDPREAIALAEYKMTVKEELAELEEHVWLGKSIPVKYISNFDTLSGDDRKSVLWEMGLNTKNFNYVVDVACYTESSLKSGTKRYCGKVVYGQERTDKKWLTTVVNGQNVASLEARYHRDRGTLVAQRNQKEGEWYE